MFQLCSCKEGFPGLAKVLGVHRFHIIGFWLVDERVPLGALSFFGAGRKRIRFGRVSVGEDLSSRSGPASGFAKPDAEGFLPGMEDGRQYSGFTKNRNLKGEACWPGECVKPACPL